MPLHSSSQCKQHAMSTPQQVIYASLTIPLATLLRRSSHPQLQPRILLSHPCSMPQPVVSHALVYVTNSTHHRSTTGGRVWHGRAATAGHQRCAFALHCCLLRHTALLQCWISRKGNVRMHDDKQSSKRLGSGPAPCSSAPAPANRMGATTQCVPCTHAFLTSPTTSATLAHSKHCHSAACQHNIPVIHAQLRHPHPRPAHHAQAGLECYHVSHTELWVGAVSRHPLAA
ncbi:hypothetical protein COO60DRAFT_709568 [Scenedesmus sp. NREL 46B-D3]|nr:hypothetical protein COO60DRAFT_709568 [Scenedesmus sp. NREL 46B-D3]